MTGAGARPRINLRLHGVALSLDSELPLFGDYVASTMQPYVSDDERPAQIVARLEWVERGAVRCRSRGGIWRLPWDRRPDRDIYVCGDRVYWLRIDDFADLKLALEWDGAVLHITGRYYFQVGRSRRGEAIRRLRYRGQLDRLRARRFSTLLYYLVYHPILWRLSRFDGWHVLHGGGVSDGDRAVVFAGMPGCGKSTLSVAMLADPRWRMLSDNLILHDGERVLACPEVLLLDPRSLERAGEGARQLVPTGERRVFARDGYRPRSTVLEPVAPAAIFNVERGHATELATLEPADACARLAVDNLLAQEVRRIAIMGEVIDLAAGTTAPDAAARLAALTDRTPCYTLTVEQGGDPAAIVPEVVLPALSAGGSRGTARG